MEAQVDHKDETFSQSLTEHGTKLFLTELPGSSPWCGMPELLQEKIGRTHGPKKYFPILLEIAGEYIQAMENRLE